MEENRGTVFNKIDSQAEKVDELSAKLEGISVDDLYALARRTYNSGDYVTAQKYFNHISLLRPLDWEAPLYASICNFRGLHEIAFWVTVPSQSKNIVISTIKYIDELDLQEAQKEKEMSRCLEILRELTKRENSLKNHFFMNKKVYDLYTETFHKKDYAYVLEEYYLDIYNEISNINSKSVEEFRKELADECLDIIEKTNKVSAKITKDVADDFVKNANNHHNIDYDKYMLNKFVMDGNFDSQCINYDVNTKGKLLFERYDKTISKRRFYALLMIGIILLFTGIFAIVISALTMWPLIFLFAVTVLNGIIALTKAITQKDVINCKSFFCANRKKICVSPDGSIIEKNVFNWTMLFAGIGILSLGGWIYLLVDGKLSDIDGSLPTAVFVVGVVSSLTSFIYSKLSLSDDISRNTGSFRYYYDGKYYTLK